jgi:chromosome segregation ATPase
MLLRRLKVRCPYCKERIRKGAVRCKHCHADTRANTGDAAASKDEGIRYLQNGFNKIASECNEIEDRINARTGMIFIRHEYTADDLLEATNRIESFVEKMENDLEDWEAANKLTQQVRQIFNKKAGEVCQRLESLHQMIERRQPTWWEVVCDVFKRILAKLFPFLTVKLVAGKISPKAIAA